MLKTWKPILNSMRGLVTITTKNHTVSDPAHDTARRQLTKPLKSSSGRDTYGHISSHHRSAGHKKMYRMVSFARKKFDIVGTIESIEYDPNRNCFISLVKYADDTFEYIISPDAIKVGDEVMASKSLLDFKHGNAMPISLMPEGAVIHNIEIRPGSGGIMARSAGCFATIMAKDGTFATLRMPSGEVRMVPSSAMATLGIVSNPNQKNVRLGKAGRNRWRGIRPTVRGVVMNPVDHPHGGGEGKTGTGGVPRSPWGKPAKGKKTRKKNKSTKKYIVKDRRN